MPNMTQQCQDCTQFIDLRQGLTFREGACRKRNKGMNNSAGLFDKLEPACSEFNYTPENNFSIHISKFKLINDWTAQMLMKWTRMPGVVSCGTPSWVTETGIQLFSVAEWNPIISNDQVGMIINHLSAELQEEWAFALACIINAVDTVGADECYTGVTNERLYRLATAKAMFKISALILISYPNKNVEQGIEQIKFDLEHYEHIRTTAAAT